jgi:hypothetical protein
MKTTRILIMMVIAMLFAMSTFAGSKTLSSENNGRSVEQKSSQKPSSNQNSYSKSQQSKGNNDKYTGNHGDKDKRNSHSNSNGYTGNHGDKDKRNNHGNSNGYTGNRSHDYKGKGDNHGYSHGPKNYGYEYDKYWSNYSPHLRPNYSHYDSYSVRIHTSPIYYGHRTCYCAYSHSSRCVCSSCGYYKTVKVQIGSSQVFSHYEKEVVGYDEVSERVWVPETRISAPVTVGEFTINISHVVPAHYEDVNQRVPRYENVARYKLIPEYRYDKQWVPTRYSRCRCY